MILQNSMTPEPKGNISNSVWAYWDTITKNQIAPTWKEFELMELYKEAPYIQVCDVLDENGKNRFRYRYVGTNIVSSRHRLEKPDFTGLYYSEVEYQYDFTSIRDAMDRCANSLEPVIQTQNFNALDAWGLQERLYLPLVKGDGTIDKLVIVRERLNEMKK